MANFWGWFDFCWLFFPPPTSKELPISSRDDLTTGNEFGLQGGDHNPSVGGAEITSYFVKTEWEDILPREGLFWDWR